MTAFDQSQSFKSVTANVFQLPKLPMNRSDADRQEGALKSDVRGAIRPSRNLTLVLAA